MGIGSSLLNYIRKFKSPSAQGESCIDLCQHDLEQSDLYFITSEHFADCVPCEVARRLFKNSVKLIEIETFSFCNRKCWFCPNSYIDRQSHNSYLDERVYLSIIQELSAIGYSDIISFSRYNEPLADRIILKRLAQASERVPGAVLHMNTNGDYLTPEYLQELYDNGLRSMKIQVYLRREERFESDLVLEKIDEMARKLKLYYQVTKRQVDWVEARLIYREMYIAIYGRDFRLNGCTRGGLVDLHEHHERTSPCLSPFHHMYVDYNGSVMLCCNVRSDSPEHKQFVIDNAGKKSLQGIYFSDKMIFWRKSLIGFGPKKEPCRGCRFGTISASEVNIARSNFLLQQLSINSRSS